MKKNGRQKIKNFDEAFDKGDVGIDFRDGILTGGLGKVVKLPPLNIPAWLAMEIENLSKIQANSKSAIVRQLLVDAIQARRKAA